MKAFKKGIKYIPYISLVLIYILTLLIFNIRYIDRKDEYFETMYNELEFHLESTLDNYSNFSSYFYEKLVNNDYVLSSIQEAYHGSEATRDDIRAELYDYFSDDYNLMTDYDIRQFHFHLPDTTSFLRMHAPDKYGDLLADARYSVWYVNEYGQYISGFEEGRIFNGYRYVYPLVYQDEHIGSVEISVSMSTVLNALTKENSNKDYCMILSREVVESKVFEDQLDNYTTSYISEDFLFDNETQSCIEQRNVLDELELKALFELIDEDELKDLDLYKELNYLVKYEDEIYEIIMIPIYNIETEPVGYFISTSLATSYSTIFEQYIFSIAMITAIFIIMIVFTIYIAKNRDLLTKLSLTDRLTKVDNRRKFDKDLNREILRSKRSKENLSLIMFDIDHFKKINDKHGHHTGDVVLETLASIVKQNIRQEDFLARFGGEEFMIILTSTKEAEASHKAEELRKLIENSIFGVLKDITISCGVYEFMKSDTYQDVIRNVDAAMYCAKKAGRNNVFSYSKLKNINKFNKGEKL